MTPEDNQPEHPVGSPIAVTPEPHRLPLEPRTPEQYRRRSRLLDAVGAIAALGSVLAGVHAIHEGPRAEATVGAEAPMPHAAGMPGEALLARHLTTGKASIDRAFEKAVANDDCETRVSVDNAVETYNHIYDGNLSRLSSSELKSQIAGDKSEVTAMRSELGLIELSAEFQKLHEDAYGPTSISVEEYQKVFAAYLEKFGLQALFDWDASTPVHDVSSGQDIPLSQMIKPLSHEKLDTRMSRQMMLGIMKSLSNLPPALVKESRIETVAMGNIDNPQAIGEDIGTTIVGFDIADMPSGTYGGVDVQTDSFDHELTHAVDYATCFKILGHFTEDTAWESLQGSFRYYADSGSDLGRGNNKRYTTVVDDDASKKAVVVTEYGATDSEEDIATSGNLILRPSLGGELFMSRSDTHVVDEKVSMLLARVSAKDSKLGKYYIKLLHSERLQEELARRTAQP